MKVSNALVAAAAAAGLLIVGSSAAGAATNKTNSEAYWEAQILADYGARVDCTKENRPDNPQSLVLTESYDFVVLKGGTGWNVIEGAAGGDIVDMGDVTNGGGQQPAISWIMTCTGGGTGS